MSPLQPEQCSCRCRSSPSLLRLGLLIGSFDFRRAAVNYLLAVSMSPKTKLKNFCWIKKYFVDRRGYLYANRPFSCPGWLRKTYCYGRFKDKYVKTRVNERGKLRLRSPMIYDLIIVEAQKSLVPCDYALGCFQFKKIVSTMR